MSSLLVICLFICCYYLYFVLVWLLRLLCQKQVESLLQHYSFTGVFVMWEACCERKEERRKEEKREEKRKILASEPYWIRSSCFIYLWMYWICRICMGGVNNMRWWWVVRVEGGNKEEIEERLWEGYDERAMGINRETCRIHERGWTCWIK